MHYIFLLNELPFMTKNSKNSVFRIVFLGTGTSQGIPVIGCKCRVCTSLNPKNSRLRSALFFSYKNYNIVIDAGPDFRQQMLSNAIEHVDAILLTHEHKDHIAGLDDIRPFNFISQKAMDVFAESRVVDSVKKEFAYVFKKDPYPGVPLMNMHTITNEDFTYKSLTIQPLRVYHWQLPIYGFRIDKVAYITDASSIPDETLAKLFDLDVLIINALRIQKHYSHFNLAEALDLVSKVQPKKAYFTHISHLLGDVEEIQKTLPKHVFLAYDGLEIFC